MSIILIGNRVGARNACPKCLEVDGVQVGRELVLTPHAGVTLSCGSNMMGCSYATRQLQLGQAEQSLLQPKPQYHQNLMRRGFGVTQRT